MAKRSGVQYREHLSHRPNYDTLENITECAPCPGTCSCNLDKRSAFDQLQNQAMVSGNSNYAFQNNVRELNFNYNNTLGRQQQGGVVVEKFSGMHDNNSLMSYYLWPARSEKCNAGLGGGTLQFAAGKGPQYREDYSSSGPWCTFANSGGTFCYDAKKDMCLPFIAGVMDRDCV